MQEWMLFIPSLEINLKKIFLGSTLAKISAYYSIDFSLLVSIIFSSSISLM